MSMYFQDFRSKSAIMAIPSATHPKPARKPAVAPHEVVVLASARNIARFADISNEKTKARPKTLPMFRLPSSSVVKWVSAIQARPKMAGEYQSPPSAKAEKAAARTANQFTCCAGIYLLRFDTY